MTPDHSIKQARIGEIAKEYRERGYRVTLEPDVDVRPGFLADFRPDLIAVTDGDFTCSARTPITCIPTFQSSRSSERGRHGRISFS